MARIFDDAMTNMSELTAPAIESAYDFGAWGSLMDIGGGNGVLLAAILKAHPGVHGTLADLPHVLERARDRGFLGGQLQARSEVRPCDFFKEVPSGCRAYLMKSVIHDWDDPQAHQILVNCRRAIPENGVLLLVELTLPEDNVPSLGRFVDIAMMVLTGGRERSTQEYRELLADAAFRLNRVITVPAEFGKGDLSIIEATPTAAL
jgi:O-methyltransferase